MPRASANANANRPIFWIVAGPNGSGKSSIYQNAALEALARSIWIINPDLLTARIRAVENLSLQKSNLEAVKRIEAWLEASIRAHQSVGVETVLSTDKYRRLVRLAKTFDFEIRLIYVILDSPERSVERVKLRVAKGGPNVPKRKIHERYEKSLKQLPWFLEESDQAQLFDNTGADPKLIGRKSGREITLDPEALEVIKIAVESIRD